MRKTSLRNALCATTLTGITLFSTITSTVAANAAPTNNQSAAAYQQTNTQIPLDDSAFEQAKKDAEAQGFTVNVTEDPTVTESGNLEQAKKDAQAKLDAAKKNIEDAVAKWKQEDGAAQAAHQAGSAKIKAAEDRLKQAVQSAKDANLVVTSGETQNITNYDEAATAMIKQAEAIEKATAEKVKLDQARAAARAVQPNAGAMPTCNPVTVAVDLDLSNSFNNDEVRQEAEAAKRTILTLSKTGANVVLNTFALTSPVDWAKGENPYGSHGEIKPIVANHQTKFDLSKPDEVAKAMYWLDHITKGTDENGNPAINVPKGGNWGDVVSNFQTAGTNYEAALKANREFAKANGIHFTNIILISDGAPTHFNVDPKTLTGEQGNFDPTSWSSRDALDAAKVIANEFEREGTAVIPVMVADPEAEAFATGGQDALIAQMKKMANVRDGIDPESVGLFFYAQNMDELSKKIEDGVNVTCATFEARDIKVPPTTVDKPVINVAKPSLAAKNISPDKVADNEGKTVLAGQSTTQHVTGHTGYRTLDAFAIGDSYRWVKDADGSWRNPVATDLSKVTVTDEAGQDVTSLFKIDQVDGVGPDGVKVHSVVAEATTEGLAQLKLNHKYTLHVTATALDDGHVDEQVDYGFSIVNDNFVYTTDHSYREYIPMPRKTVNTSDGVDANGKTVLPGQALTYKIELDADKFTPKDLAEKLESLGAEDEYDHNYFTPDGSYRVTASDGTDVTNDFEFNADENGKATLKAKADRVEALTAMGTDFTWELPGVVKNDAKPGEFSNTAAQLTNGHRVQTNTVKNIVPKVEPHKYDLSPVDGSNINGKSVVVGDTLNYALVGDASNLNNTAYNVSKFGHRDDYDQDHVAIQKDAVKVFKVPSNTDTSNVNTLHKLATAGEDVTGQFDMNDDGDNFTLTMKTTEKDGKQVLVGEMGVKYIYFLPAKVIKNTNADIPNTSWQIVNNDEHVTETVVNPLKKIEPSKDIVVDHEHAKDSLDGKTIELGATFNYKLNSSTLPSNRASEATSWSITDKYDIKHDQYEGNFEVFSRAPIFGENGEKIVDTDGNITKYFTQEIDAKNGTVKYVASEDFLKLMNLDANKKQDQGFTVYMQTTRIADGEKIENTFVENFNGNDLVSNTVVTNTPKPPAPQEDNPPAEPTPEPTPPSTPTTPPAPTPAPNDPPQPNKQEWHTGEGGNSGVTFGYGALAVGAAGAATVLSVSAAKARRKRKAEAAEVSASE